MTRNEKLQLLKDYQEGKVSDNYFAMMTKPSKTFITYSNHVGLYTDQETGKKYTESQMDEKFRKKYFILIFKISVQPKEGEDHSIYYYK